MPSTSGLRVRAAPGRGFVVVRQLGVVAGFEVSAYKLMPATRYTVYLGTQQVGALRTDDKGNANVTMIGPVRQFASAGSADRATPSSKPEQLLIMEGDAAPSAAAAVLVSE